MPKKKEVGHANPECKGKFRKVGTVTKKDVTFVIEACRKCHATRIR